MKLSPYFKQGTLLALLVLAADQLSKWWILHVYDLPNRATTEILPFFNLTMVWNKGISMGMLQADGDLGRWLLVGATLLVAIGLMVWLLRAENKLVALALGAIIGGALGNIIDRALMGAVADFIHLHGFGYSFWVFNVADAAISLGVIALIIDGLRGGDKSLKRDDK